MGDTLSLIASITTIKSLFLFVSLCLPFISFFNIFSNRGKWHDS